MTALTIAIITFALTFGCAWIGTAIRATLPAQHLSKESQDVVRLGMGLVATMTALLLGLVTAAAKGSYDSQDTAIKNSAASIVTLDRLLARYGPETTPIRDLLQRTVKARVEEVWPERGDAGDLNTAQGPAPAEAIENAILSLTPSTDSQRWFKAEALKLTSEVLKTRWRLFGTAGGSVSRTLLAVVVFWLTMTFASFGLYAPRNATVLTVLFIASISVAAAVFLILELDDPFHGIIKISNAPMQFALSNLGH